MLTWEGPILIFWPMDLGSVCTLNFIFLMCKIGIIIRTCLYMPGSYMFNPIEKRKGVDFAIGKLAKSVHTTGAQEAAQKMVEKKKKERWWKDNVMLALFAVAVTA